MKRYGDHVKALDVVSLLSLMASKEIACCKACGWYGHEDDAQQEQVDGTMADECPKCGSPAIANDLFVVANVVLDGLEGRKS